MELFLVFGWHIGGSVGAPIWMDQQLHGKVVVQANKESMYVSVN